MAEKQSPLKSFILCGNLGLNFLNLNFCSPCSIISSNDLISTNDDILKILYS